MFGRGSRFLLAVLLTAGTAAFGVMLATSAQAANDAPAPCTALTPCPPTATINGLPPGATGGSFTVTWTANGGVVTSPTLMLSWPVKPPLPPGAPQPKVTSETLTGTCTPPLAATVQTCTYQWPTDMMVSGYVLNGTYDLSGSATDCGINLHCPSGALLAADNTTLVVNPAVAPTGVTAVPDGKSQVTVTWAANPEPDVAQYQVFRNGVLVATLPAIPANKTAPPASYTYTDAPNKDGSYTYTVAADRYGATYGGAAVGGAASAPTKGVPVTGTAANPTTTTVAGGGVIGGFIAKPVPGVVGGKIGNFGGRSTPGTVASDTATTPDPGFNPLLPYSTPPASSTGTTDPAVIAAPPPAHKGKGSIGAIAAVGGGLLIAVIALHGLWLRSEVRRSGTLEVLDPE